MSKKTLKILEPGLRLYLLVLVLFAAVTVFFDLKLAVAEGVIILVLVVYSLVSHRRRRRELQRFVESVTYNAESATNNTLIHFPLPMAVFRLNDSGVVWANQPFWTMCGKNGPSFEAKLSELVPRFDSHWLLEGKTRQAELLEVDGRKYEVNGNMVRSGQDKASYEFMGITYWVDVTDYDAIKQEYQHSRPTVAMIVVDNYDELIKPLSDRQRIELRGQLDEVVERWSAGRGGILRRYDRDRYVFIFEKRYLEEIVRNKFALVDEIHSITGPAGIHATVSIGVGVDGASYEEDYSFANLATEMALSRGGDQAVIKNKFNFEFYGGRAAEVETRTKVKSRVMANALSQLIQDASQVFIMGHRFADLDAMGAAVGVACIARKLECPFKIVLEPERHAAASLVSLMETVPEYAEAFITPQDAILRADNRTLLVVVDTHRPEQVENETLLTACSNRLAVIDHHRRASTYIRNATLSLYEPNASSACELVAELMQELVEKQDVLAEEADAVLAGIVLDTKSFTLRTGERTFDAAAFLRRSGGDTVRVKRLFQNGLEETLERYNIMKQAKVYRDIAVAVAPENQDRIIAAQAADELLNIEGVTASVVMFPSEDGGVSLSARSIDKVNVQVLLEKLGGGGNKSAACAQIKNISLRDAVNKLFAAIDEYMDTE